MAQDRVKAAKEIYAFVHNVLWNDWDPIGTNGSGPDDEYDSYIGQIVTLLNRDASEGEIADRLGEIVVEKMGIQANPKIDQIVAEKLKTGFKSRFAN